MALLRLDFFFYLTSSRHSVARPQMLTLPPRRKLGSKERSGGDDVTTAFHKALAMKESKIKGNFLVVNAVLLKLMAHKLTLGRHSAEDINPFGLHVKKKNSSRTHMRRFNPSCLLLSSTRRKTKKKEKRKKKEKKKKLQHRVFPCGPPP